MSDTSEKKIRKIENARTLYDQTNLSVTLVRREDRACGNALTVPAADVGHSQQYCPNSGSNNPFGDQKKGYSRAYIVGSGSQWGNMAPRGAMKFSLGDVV